ncbi:MAG: hypothetical protein HG454_006730 [Clostridiales bacterium]|jgi:hypothetical protein|nr:hypothetical protein [Clostridiales bacterium]
MEFMVLKKIKENLDNYFGGNSGIELEDLEFNLRPVGKVGNSYTILAIQKGDLTILLWIKFRQDGLKINKIKTVSW